MGTKILFEMNYTHIIRILLPLCRLKKLKLENY